MKEQNIKAYTKAGNEELEKLVSEVEFRVKRIKKLMSAIEKDIERK